MYERSEEAVPSWYGGFSFWIHLGSYEPLMQEMEAKVSQLSANSARLAVELGTWRKHPRVVTSLLGVFMHVTTGFLASKRAEVQELRQRRWEERGRDHLAEQRFACPVSFFFSKVRWTFQHLLAGKMREFGACVDFCWLGYLRCVAGIDGWGYGSSKEAAGANPVFSVLNPNFLL